MQHGHWFKEEQNEKRTMQWADSSSLQGSRNEEAFRWPWHPGSWNSCMMHTTRWADESVRYVWKHCPLEMKETRKQQIFRDKGWRPAFLLKTANQIAAALFLQNSSLKSRHSSYSIQTVHSGMWKRSLFHTPPVRIVGLIMSKLHQQRAEEKCLVCFALTSWESESVLMLRFGWTNCFGGAWGMQEPNPLGAFDNRGGLLAGHCCRVGGRTSSMWFLLDLHCARE